MENRIGDPIKTPFPRIKRLGEEVGYLMIPLGYVGNITLTENNFCISVVKYFYTKTYISNNQFERKMA